MSQAGKQAGAGAASGAATGAAAGAMFGPWGAAIGGIGGAIGGGIGGYVKGKGDDKRAQQKKAAWAKAQQQIAAARASNIAGTGALMEAAYSPMANMMGQVYGQDAAPSLANPLAGSPQAIASNPQEKKGGRGVTVRPEDWNETSLKKPDNVNVEIGDAQMQQWSPSIGEAQMKQPGRPRAGGRPKPKGKK